MTAVVLAGGARDAVAERDPAAPNKAFLAICGRTLVERTIDALRATPRVERIIAVAPAEAARHPALGGADETRPSGARIGDSLRVGLEGLAPDATVLVAASDLPVLTGAAVDDFLDRVEVLSADVVYACLARATHVARFPEVPHTWAHLREGDFCGGGLIALRPGALDQLDRFLERLGAARKNPLRLAQIFGWDFLARYALRTLAIADAEHRASTLLGVRVRAAVCTHAEIAVNVDRPSDVQLAERLITTIA